MVVDETDQLLDESSQSGSKHNFFCKSGLLLLSFTVSVALVEYLCRTPDFDSLDTALPDGILRFERLVGRQMPNHFRSLAGQEAHLRQLRVARAVKLGRPLAGPEDPYTIAQCVGAIYDMANYIGWAGLNIDALAINGTCPDTEDDTTCSAQVVGLFFNLMWVLNNAAQIPIWCVRDFEENNTRSKTISCLVSMSLFLASSLQITGDGIAVKVDCAYLRQKGILEFDSFQDMLEDRLAQLKPRQLPPKSERKASNVSSLPAPAWARLRESRRLEADDLFPDETRAQARGVCSMISVQLANDLPYTGIDIWGAVKDCGTLTNRTLQQWNEDCAADAFSVISDIINLVTDFLVVYAACRFPEFPEQLPCTADSTDITSNLFAIGAWAFTVNHACNPLAAHDGSVNFDIPLKS